MKNRLAILIMSTLISIVCKGQKSRFKEADMFMLDKNNRVTKHSDASVFSYLKSFGIYDSLALDLDNLDRYNLAKYYQIDSVFVVNPTGKREKIVYHFRFSETQGLNQIKGNIITYSFDSRMNTYTYLKDATVYLTLWYCCLMHDEHRATFLEIKTKYPGCPNWSLCKKQ